MKRVIIESPFAGDVKKNIEYARLCIKDSLNRGEAPIASHLLYTQKGILDDNKPEERDLGINAGLSYYDVVDYCIIYIDLGISKGMKKAIKLCEDKKLNIEYRKILC